MADDSKVWTVLTMLEWATTYFREKSVPSPRLSIEWLLSHVLIIKRLNLYVQFDRPLNDSELGILREFIKRRAKHEPLQYITGSTDFYNATIAVNPSVLIPRPETEQLVEIILSDHPATDSSQKTILDIGTGSGCIAIAIKQERPLWTVNALDISSDAIGVAKENAKLNQTEIHFLEGDALDITKMPKNKFDIIVSNPPYINRSEETLLEAQVKDFEPHLALFCNSQDEIYEQIGTYALNHLNESGYLYMELHENYDPLKAGVISGFKKQEILKDYSGKIRFLRAGTE